MSSRSTFKSTIGAGFALAAGTVLAFTACTSGGDTAANSPTDLVVDVPFGPSTPAAVGSVDSINWMLATEPGTLDLDIRGSATEDTVMSNVCERLMQVQPDLTTKPHIAESVEWTDDTHVVFTIRTDAVFHDGSPVTTDDVLWSMQRHSADGADESDEYQNVVGLAKTAENQITATMAQRDAVFVQAMAGDGGIVLNPRIVEQLGADFGGPGAPDACSGPYALADWKPGTSITITKAENYWDPAQTVLVDEIVFTWAAQATVANSLIAGESDGSYLATPASALPLLGTADVTLAQGPSTNAWVLMATDRGALTDVRLRQALSLALDREGVSQAAFGGLAQPSKTPIGQGAWGYERDQFEAAYEALEGSPSAPSTADFAAAEVLVKEAGVPTEPLIIASDGAAVRTVLANALKDAASKLGIEATIINVPAAQYLDYYSDAELRRTADVWIDEYAISKNDPVGFYKNGATDARVNFVGFSDPDFDALVKQAQAATDDEDRVGLAIELQERWNEAMPWISVTQSPATVALSASYTGVPSSAAYMYYPWAADLGSAE